MTSGQTLCVKQRTESVFRVLAEQLISSHSLLQTTQKQLLVSASEVGALIGGLCDRPWASSPPPHLLPVSALLFWRWTSIHLMMYENPKKDSPLWRASVLKRLFRACSPGTLTPLLPWGSSSALFLCDFTWLSKCMSSTKNIFSSDCGYFSAKRSAVVIGHWLVTKLTALPSSGNLL